MEGRSSALSQRWTKGKQDTLVSDWVFALGVGLLVLTMAIVFISAVLPHAEFYVSRGTAVGVGASSAPWSALGGYCGESKAHIADAAQWNIVTEWPTAEVLQGP